MIRLRDVVAWWTRRHPPLAKLPAWKAAYRAEKRALAIGCTRAVGKARKDMQAAVLANLRGMA